MKTAFCLLTTKFCTELIERYNNMKQEDLDFFLLLDTSIYKDPIPEFPNLITFNGSEIWKKYNSFTNDHRGNPQFVLLEFRKRYPDYDYYWFCEDDIYMPNGNYREFFKECKKIECDLLLSKLQNFPDRWYWYKFINRQLYPVYQLVQLFRLSKAGIDIIIDQFNPKDQAHSEAAIPSIIYRNGLTTRFIEQSTKFKFKISWEPLDIIDNQRNTFYHPMKL